MSLFERLLGKPSRDWVQPSVVRAFLVALDPGLVIGIRREGEWYLPGGIVEGAGTPAGMPHGSHFESLAWYLTQQSGLQLTGLSDAVGLGISYEPDGPYVTVLYVGRATGKQTGGTQFELESLPEFAAICAVDDDQIRDICSRL